MDGLSAVGMGFFFPKNSLGLEAWEPRRGLGWVRGLEELLWPVGLKLFAAGFGTNS